MFDTEVAFGIDVLEIILTLHLLGVVVGAGAAFFSDFLFNFHMQNRTIETKEYRELRFASHVTWIGLGVIAITGFLVFLSDIDKYLDSSKFLAKMTIVAIIAINGVVFDVKSIPVLEKFKNKKLLGNKEFFEKSRALFIGGAVSATSWTAAVVLGGFRSVEASYWTIMGIYLGVIVVACVAAEYIHNRYLKKHK